MYQFVLCRPVDRDLGANPELVGDRSSDGRQPPGLTGRSAGFVPGEGFARMFVSHASGRLISMGRVVVPLWVRLG